jgi:hypothetical protein
MLKQIVRFVRGLFRRPKSAPGSVPDSPEMVLEKERRRGVRGD